MDERKALWKEETMQRMSFQAWKRLVDAALLAGCGMVGDDLPDYGYWDAYEDGVDPRTVAKRVIRAAGEY